MVMKWCLSTTRHVRFKLEGKASSKSEKMLPSINKTSGSIIGNYLNPVSFSRTTIKDNVANIHQMDLRASERSQESWPARTREGTRNSSGERNQDIQYTKDLRNFVEKMGSGETRNSSEHSSMDMYSRLKPSLDDLKGYEVGDMVWGKVKSHPWWPGQIFDEALASPSICRAEKEGQVLVAFYGDGTYGWFEPGRLIPFDFHYTEKSKQTNTPEFLTAVGEAVDEVKRRAALGLTCRCRNPNIFRPKSVEGFFEVDVSGFQPGGLYSKKQIERARDAFQSSKILSFMKQLALMPQDDVQRNVEWTNNVASVLAYRRAVFEEFDETYAQAFRLQPVRPGVSVVGLHNPEKAPLQAPLGKRKAFEDRVKVKDQQNRKKSLSRQSNDQKTSKVSKFGKAGICISENRVPLVSIKPKFLGNQDTDGNVRKGKEVITTDKHPILAQREGPTALLVETPHIEKVKDQPSALKTLKKPFRPDDPAKAGSKSQSSRKQEEKSMKRPKKYRKLSSLAAENKEGSQKHLKIRGDEKMVGSSVSTTPEILEGPSEPAMLTMKFPLHSKLPSVPELKAKFIRFGSLYESATRVFQNSSTAKVVFKNKSSAEAAYNHAVLNRTFLGNIKVNYRLQVLNVSAPELPESGESSKRLVEGSLEPKSTAIQQLPLHPSVPLKSILKKSLGDEMVSINSVKTATQHVRFKLEGNASSGKDKMLPSINKISGSIIGNYLNPISSSRTTIKDNVANFHQVMPPTLPPQLSLPSQIPAMHENRSVGHIVNAINKEYLQGEATSSKSYQNASAPTNSIDISQQMLYLLKKCSEIVANLKSSSG
ncbi:unnamed protein product [Camellia sinensis]